MRRDLDDNVIVWELKMIIELKSPLSLMGSENSKSLQKCNIKKNYENSKFNKFITKPLNLKYFHKTENFH